MATDSPQTARISIYSELLRNIRQVSVAATLPSPSNSATTRAAITADGRAIRVSHSCGISTSDVELGLPAPVQIGPVPSATSSSAAGDGGVGLGGVQRPPVQILPVRSGVTTLTWRLPIGAGQGAILASARAVAGHEDDSAVPWPASDLRAGEPVRCRACGAVLVSVRAIEMWKDLPSENWAEMMEFWHCHKPGEEGHGHAHGHGREGHGQKTEERSSRDDADPAKTNGGSNAKSLGSRGYGANSTIIAQQGIGFVDVMSFLLSEADCKGILYSLASGVMSSRPGDLMEKEDGLKPFSTRLSCASCAAQLGYYNYRNAAVTLFKWQVSFAATGSRQPSVPECLSATLIATIFRTGCSKSILVPVLDANPTSTQQAALLHLWVLNSNLHYTSSDDPDSSGGKALPALKVLYRTVPRQEADALLDAVTSDVQEVNLPVAAIMATQTALEAGNALLPPTERVFRGWNVGLLRRWEAT
ncbi:hypothetical protein VTK73DRAFT_2259 [Phialemonium thermophilum]|uniref:Ubiquitin-conjugating enzyme E2C-binding protein n=1 Tax=Phialemonium thermophilum TaxID=223376 RepID=A0ABR3X5U1_9PEZI